MVLLPEQGGGCTRDADSPTTGIRGDYAANGGDIIYAYGVEDTVGNYTTAATHVWPNPKFTGVCLFRSEVKLADITDGASKTYMVGEKNINPFNYLNGLDNGDNNYLLEGLDKDNIRWGDFPISGNTSHSSCLPYPDTPGAEYCINFGSAHV